MFSNILLHLLLILLLDSHLFQHALPHIYLPQPLQHLPHALANLAHIPYDHQAPLSHSGVVLIHPCMPQHQPHIRFVPMQEYLFNCLLLEVSKVCKEFRYFREETSEKLGIFLFSYFCSAFLRMVGFDLTHGVYTGFKGLEEDEDGFKEGKTVKVGCQLVGIALILVGGLC